MTTELDVLDLSDLEVTDLEIDIVEGESSLEVLGHGMTEIGASSTYFPYCSCCCCTEPIPDV